MQEQLTRLALCITTMGRSEGETAYPVIFFFLLLRAPLSWERGFLPMITHWRRQPPA
jgi:hypothetical protein